MSYKWQKNGKNPVESAEMSYMSGSVKKQGHKYPRNSGKES
ncbi:hypothetical protein [Paenibacillus sp. B2(2019)]|nr:hypothetical protein [Paenibacillus sp. B2(2019)]